MLNAEQSLDTVFSYTLHQEQQGRRLSFPPVMARDRAHYVLVSGGPIMITCPKKEGRNSVHRIRADTYPENLWVRCFLARRHNPVLGCLSFDTLEQMRIDLWLSEAVP